MTPFQFVDDPGALSALIPQLQREPELALDTEFMREQTYFPRLCLIQFGTPEAAFAVDPLALQDLSAVADVLANGNICKVVHAARQDVEVLMTRSSQLPTNLFDTQVAAALCGLSPQIGYGDLVQKILGVQLDKAHSRTDWAQRPLTPEQLKYAAEDVHHLLPLRSELQQRLEGLGRYSWFESEMARLSDARLFRMNPQDAWQRLRGLDTQDERRMAVAKAVAQWREERAISRDRPRGWILADDAIYELIKVLPKDLAELEQLRNVPPGVIKKSGAELMAAITASEHLPANTHPGRRYVPPDVVHQKKLKALSAAVQDVAKRLNLSPEVLATRRDLLALLNGQTDALKGWRREVLGDVLLGQL